MGSLRHICLHRWPFLLPRNREEKVLINLALFAVRIMLLSLYTPTLLKKLRREQVLFRKIKRAVSLMYSWTQNSKKSQCFSARGIQQYRETLELIMPKCKF